MSIGNDIADVMAFHIGRIIHQAGRCIECDACVRACPMDIDLRPFTNLIAKDIEELFDYIPGHSLEENPPLLVFDENDDGLVTEPNEQD